MLLLCRTDFEGYSEDETVRVVMSGNQEPRGIDFTDQALDAGSEVHPFHGNPNRLLAELFTSVQSGICLTLGACSQLAWPTQLSVTGFIAVVHASTGAKSSLQNTQCPPIPVILIPHQKS